MIILVVALGLASFLVIIALLFIFISKNASIQNDIDSPTSDSPTSNDLTMGCYINKIAEKVYYDDGSGNAILDQYGRNYNLTHSQIVNKDGKLWNDVCTDQDHPICEDSMINGIRTQGPDRWIENTDPLRNHTYWHPANIYHKGCKVISKEKCQNSDKCDSGGICLSWKIIPEEDKKLYKDTMNACDFPLFNHLKLF